MKYSLTAEGKICNCFTLGTSTFELQAIYRVSQNFLHISIEAISLPLTTVAKGRWQSDCYCPAWQIAEWCQFWCLYQQRYYIGPREGLYTLANISKKFVYRIPNIIIYTFYETEKLYGVRVVDKQLALTGLKNERTFLVNANQSTICEIPSSTSHQYKTVVFLIAKLTQQVLANAIADGKLIPNRGVGQFVGREITADNKPEYDETEIGTPDSIQDDERQILRFQNSLLSPYTVDHTPRLGMAIQVT